MVPYSIYQTVNNIKNQYHTLVGKKLSEKLASKKLSTTSFVRLSVQTKNTGLKAK